MPRRQSNVAVAAAFLLWATAAAAASPPGPQTLHPDASGSARLLDVPYLPQTEDLCGGAAVAMVLRYWGERQAVPEDFAALVDRSASGIRTDVLTSDVKRRGWQALPFNAGPSPSSTWMREQIDRGRPVIALIEVRPNRYHYVVVVAWTSDRVIVHDPARAPFRLLSRAEFDRAWTAAGDWALLLLPPEGRSLERSAASASRVMDVPSRADACGDLVQEMVGLARTGRHRRRRGRIHGSAPALSPARCRLARACRRSVSPVSLGRGRYARRARGAARFERRAGLGSTGDEPFPQR